MTVTELRQARQDSANVAYQTFIKHISDNKEGLFFFYEGNDAPYYNLRIKLTVPGRKTYPIVCNGKKMVIKVFQLINNHREYDKYDKGFFIDRDFDPPIESIYPQAFYETPAYSIENFYVGKETFEEILKNELKMTEVDISFQTSVALYEKSLKSLLEAQTLFNIWYYSLKEKKQMDNLSTTNVNLEDKFPNNFISFSLDAIKCNYTLESIRQAFPEAIQVEEVVISANIEKFKTLDKLMMFRGKYLLEFLQKFLSLLINDSNVEKKFLKEKIKYHIDNSKIISTYSQYAFTPPCLITYLQKFK